MPDRHASTATLPLAPLASTPAPDPAGRPAAPRRVQVLLPLPLTGPYDYLVPPEIAEPAGMVVPGSVVVVPLAQRELVGVVWDAPPASAPTAGKPQTPEKLRASLEELTVTQVTRVARRFVAWDAHSTHAATGRGVGRAR